MKPGAIILGGKSIGCFEALGKVRRRRKAKVFGNQRNWIIRKAQHISGMITFSLYDILLQRHSLCFLKFTCKISSADSDRWSDFRNCDIFPEIGFHKTLAILNKGMSPPLVLGITDSTGGLAVHADLLCDCLLADQRIPGAA